MAKKLAIEGGEPVCTEKWPVWPSFEQSTIEAAMEPLRTGKVNYWTGEQGMAFEKLGDLESARYLYGKVTKEHPESEQARMAEHRLKNIP